MDDDDDLLAELRALPLAAPRPRLDRRIAATAARRGRGMPTRWFRLPALLAACLALAAGAQRFTASAPQITHPPAPADAPGRLSPAPTAERPVLGIAQREEQRLPSPPTLLLIDGTPWAVHEERHVQRTRVFDPDSGRSAILTQQTVDLGLTRLVTY